jgi:hypothetical protein
MSEMVCSCGIKCNQWISGAAVCPRCKIIYLEKAGKQVVVRGQQAAATIEAVENLIGEALAIFDTNEPDSPRIKTDPRRARGNSTALVPCDLCGELIEDRCGAKCGNCGWIKPCGLS